MSINVCYDQLPLSNNTSLQNTNNNVFDVFYDMLNQIKESYKHNSLATPLRDGEHYEQLMKDLDTLNIPFSGEEGFGRYLDLHEYYNRYINAKFGHPLKYIDYVNVFHAVDDENIIPSKAKSTVEYKGYIKGILEYLVSFMDRTQPLLFLDRIFKKIEDGFEENWGKNLPRGRKRDRTTSGVYNVINQYEKIEDFVELGSLRLKEMLDALGLKSGGTLRQKAERVLLVKNNPLGKIDQKLYKREEKEEGRRKEIAAIEAKVKKLCEILKDTIERTRQHIENKQGMTDSERTAEIEDNERAMPTDVESDEDDITEIGNPLKLPIGWDGKPIPYWLYNMHGLGKEFKCEICGGYVYKGRQAFEKHFTESRHQQGMRCLGIPNTKSFYEITSIEDAKKLWENIQQRQNSVKWLPDVDEEFEDDEGNVYDKKTFTDLVRQGLI